jgi:hypothetical protein
MDLDTLLTLLFICLPILFAFVCFYYALYFMNVARNIEDSPTAKIRSAAQGYVELKGTAKSLSTQTTTAKLTQKPCAWYRYTIEYFQTTTTSEQTTAYWNLLDEGVSTDFFLLCDETGQCVINPKGAEIITTTCTSWRGHTQLPTPPSTSFLRWLFWESWGPYRYTEYRLELDAPLYVSGMFRTLQPNQNILEKEGLSRNEHYIISMLAESRLVRQFKIKAFVFFIVFVFFAIVSVHSSYPMIKNSFQNWHQYKSFTHIIK